MNWPKSHGYLRWNFKIRYLFVEEFQMSELGKDELGGILSSFPNNNKKIHKSYLDA